MKAPIIKVRLLSYVHIAGEVGVMTFAAQEVDRQYVVQPTWRVRTSVVKAGKAADSLIVAQTIRTEDLAPSIAETSAPYNWGCDETAALALVRSM